MLNQDDAGRPFSQAARQGTTVETLLQAIESHLAAIAEFVRPRDDYQSGYAVLMKNSPQMLRGYTRGRRSIIVQNLAVNVSGNVYVYKDKTVMIQAGGTTTYNGALLLVSGSWSLYNNAQAVWVVSDTDNVVVNWTED